MEVSLRYYTPTSKTCPKCYKPRHIFDGRTKICRVCRERELLANIDARTAKALLKLGADERGKYGNTESLLDDVRITPVAVSPKANTPYYIAKAKEAAEIENEQNLISELHRLNKARSKRLERINKKIRNF